MYKIAAAARRRLLSFSETFFSALAVLACDEDHPSARNSLILLPDPDRVGGGLGRACTVPGLPAGRVSCTRFLQTLFQIRQLSVRPVNRSILSSKS